MSHTHGESLMEDGDEVLRSSHHQSQPPLKKFRYQGRCGSRIFRKLRAQGAAEGFKPFVNASSWPPPNSMEGNHEFDTGKPRNGKFPKDFLGKRPWRSSGGPQHLNPTAKKPRWDLSTTASDCVPRVYREPEPLQKSTLSPYYTDQASVRESCGENQGLQNNSGHPTHNDHLQSQSTHFKHSHEKSRWSCRWTYDTMGEERDPLSINFEHRIHQERIVAQNSRRSAYDPNHSQVAAEQRGLVREIRQERYKKHERWGGAPFHYRKGNRPKHVWIRNSSHQEQTVDSSISYRGKQQPLAPNSSLCTHEEEQAVVRKSGPQYSKERKMQISGEQLTQYKPMVTSTTRDDEHKVVVVNKSKMKTPTQQPLVQKSGPPTDKEPQQRNRIVEKRSATTQVECVAALDSGPSVHKEEHSTGQKIGIQSRPDVMSRRVVTTQKKSLAQEHAAGKNQSTQRCNQDHFTSRTPGAQEKDGSAAPSPNVQKSNGSPIHDQAHVSAQKLGADKEPAVNHVADPSVHKQPPPVHKSNALAHDQEHVTAKKSSGSPLRKKLARDKPSPAAAAAAHHDPPKAKGGKADQDHIQLREQKFSALEEHSPLKIPIDPATPSCLEQGNVDQGSGTPTRKEQTLVQNSETEAKEDLGHEQNSTNLVEIPLLRLMELIFEEDEFPRSEEVVCRTCGHVGYRELLVYCTSCKISAQHRYCMNGLISMDEEDLTWVCEDCVGRFPELDSLNKHQSTSGKKALRHENSSFAINIIQNDREEDEARKDSNSKEMINGCEMNEVGYSNLYEDGGNHNPPTSSEDRGSPFPQGEEDCVNEDFHFMKRKRRRRLIIYESEEEIDDDLTSSDTSKEGDVRGNPSMCDMSPELKARPTIEPIWRGWFEICGHNYGMLLGHLSSKACLRVYEGAKLLEHVTRVEMLPRTDAWPKTFERSPPSSDSIGLYFFPENLCDEKMFDKLMNEINSQDLVLKVILDEVELLIFSSRLLPQSTRFCGKYYLWGAFRARKKPAISDHQSMGDDHRRIPNPKASSVWEEEIKGQGCGKTSRSDLGQREMRVEGRSASDRNGMSRGIARPARFRRRPSSPSWPSSSK